MTSWRKRLTELLESDAVKTYRYDELAILLDNLHFSVMGKGGSHRTWRRELPSGNVVSITLVKSGHGPVNTVYVKKMRTLLLGSAEIMEEVNRDERTT